MKDSDSLLPATAWTNVSAVHFGNNHWQLCYSHGKVSYLASTIIRIAFGPYWNTGQLQEVSRHPKCEPVSQAVPSCNPPSLFQPSHRSFRGLQGSLPLSVPVGSRSGLYNTFSKTRCFSGKEEYLTKPPYFCREFWSSAKMSNFKATASGYM